MIDLIRNLLAKGAPRDTGIDGSGAYCFYCDAEDTYSFTSKTYTLIHTPSCEWDQLRAAVEAEELSNVLKGSIFSYQPMYGADTKIITDPNEWAKWIGGTPIQLTKVADGYGKCRMSADTEHEHCICHSYDRAEPNSCCICGEYCNDCLKGEPCECVGDIEKQLWYARK